jgi:hypothetical protein
VRRYHKKATSISAKKAKPMETPMAMPAPVDIPCEVEEVEDDAAAPLCEGEVLVA